MDSPGRNGDAHIPGLIVIAYEDVYGAVSFIGGGPDIQLLCDE
jgi:hypothetical protein